jgi:hypothetical protein
MMESNFKTRLEEEFTSLQDKISKLEVFIMSDDFDNIDPNQKALLRIQLSAMLTYSDCLEERLILLNTK